MIKFSFILTFRVLSLKNYKRLQIRDVIIQILSVIRYSKISEQQIRDVIINSLIKLNLKHIVQKSSHANSLSSKSRNDSKHCRKIFIENKMQLTLFIFSNDLRIDIVKISSLAT